jgi:hypothetical protein
MSRSGILPALLVLTLSLCISSNAEARKRAWYYSNGFSAPFRDGDSQHTRAEGRRARIEGRGDQTEKRGNRAEERFGSTRARAADAICRHAIKVAKKPWVPSCVAGWGAQRVAATFTFNGRSYVEIDQGGAFVHSLTRSTS